MKVEKMITHFKEPIEVNSIINCTGYNNENVKGTIEKCEFLEDLDLYEVTIKLEEPIDIPNIVNGFSVKGTDDEQLC